MADERKDRNEEDVPRRKFLNGFLGGTFAAVGAAVVWPVVNYLRPPRIAEAPTNRVLAAKVSELAEKRWKIFPFGSEPGMIIEVAPGDYRAFEATCTHLSCTVQYEEETKRIWCACHNGWYDLSGRVVSGPPPHPLERYEVNVVGDDIFVVRS